jgi:hypothetical protein
MPNPPLQKQVQLLLQGTRFLPVGWCPTMLPTGECSCSAYTKCLFTVLGASASIRLQRKKYLQWKRAKGGKEE